MHNTGSNALDRCLTAIDDMREWEGRYYDAIQGIGYLARRIELYQGKAEADALYLSAISKLKAGPNV